MLNSTLANVIVILLTMLALFMDDLRLLAFPKEADVAFGVGTRRTRDDFICICRTALLLCLTFVTK